MSESTVNKSDMISLLYRQLKWLNDAELSVLAKKFDFDDTPVNGGLTLCHHIVHNGHLKAFVDFCRVTFDSQVKARQNPPKHRIKDILVKTIESGIRDTPSGEKIDIFTRCINFSAFCEFKKQKELKKRELTDDEKFTILVAFFDNGALEKKIFDSYLWRAFWLRAVDAVQEDIEDEEDRCDYSG